jgi:hypothetical protein
MIVVRTLLKIGGTNQRILQIKEVCKYRQRSTKKYMKE